MSNLELKYVVFIGLILSGLGTIAFVITAIAISSIALGIILPILFLSAFCVLLNIYFNNFSAPSSDNIRLKKFEKSIDFTPSRHYFLNDKSLVIDADKEEIIITENHLKSYYYVFRFNELLSCAKMSNTSKYYKYRIGITINKAEHALIIFHIDKQDTYDSLMKTMKFIIDNQQFYSDCITSSN